MGSTDLDKFFLQRQIPHIKPFYALEIRTDQDIIDWIKTADVLLTGYYEPLFKEQKNNLRMFLNVGFNPNFFSPLVATYLQQGMIYDAPDDIEVNELYRIVMDQISLIVANQLVPQVLANNDDYKDKIAAKVVKEWLESISYDLDIDMHRVKWEIQKKVFGECFIFPEWDEERGDLLPEAKEYYGEELAYVDENGREVFDESGRKMKIKKYMRQGDITLKNPMPFETMLDPKMRREDCNWAYYVDWVETDYLARKYKDKNINWNLTNRKQGNDSVGDKSKSIAHHTKVYYFYHRSMEFLPEGRKIILCENGILEDKTLEDMPSIIESQEIPFVSFYDLELGAGCRGTPILFRNLKNVTGGYNRLTNQIYKNLEAESPKIFVHETAAVDAQRMPTGIVVMEWRGAHKPTIEVPQTNTNSIFKFREDLKQNILEMGLQTPITRGQTPNAQLDSFIALQHFEDQRVQLASADIKGHINSMEHLYRLIIAICKDKYDPEDDRLIKILGRNQKFNLKYFDPINLDKVYDVKITTTGNLANSKAARTQLIMTIKREFPNTISDDLFIDLMELSQSEKFVNSITAAVNSAEAENEDMLDGLHVLPPEKYEELITHWDLHRIPMQSQEFKHAPQDVKDIFERHMTLTEKLMFEQANESQTFAARLANLRQFPLFYLPTPANEPQQLAVNPNAQQQLPSPQMQELGGVPENLSAPTEEGSESPPFNQGGENAMGQEILQQQAI